MASLPKRGGRPYRLRQTLLRATVAKRTGAFIQFLRVTQGSIKELETHLIIARRLDFASAEPTEKLLSQCDELGRMVRGLIRSLQDKQKDV